MSNVQEMIDKLEVVSKKVDTVLTKLERRTLDDDEVWLRFMGVFVMRGNPEQAGKLADACLQQYKERKVKQGETPNHKAPTVNQ